MSSLANDPSHDLLSPSKTRDSLNSTPSPRNNQNHHQQPVPPINTDTTNHTNADSTVLLSPLNTTTLPTSNLDFSTPSSASSATSFQRDRPLSSAVLDVGGSSSTREDIEMDNIGPTGHRRRRSTLTGGANNPTIPTYTRPRGQSIRNTGSLGLSDEQKISEENQLCPIPATPRTDDADQRDSFSDEDLHDDEETGLTKKDKKRKRAKRQRNTRLDNRIAREKITSDEKKEAKEDMMKNIVINAILIGLWYLFSLSISLYNKWMFDSNRLNFPFPLFTTSMHMLVQFSLAGLVLYFIPALRPQNASHNSDLGRSRHESEPERPLMTKMFYLTRIGPCGAATGLDIGLGNTSLKFITLTFYTMCKSSSLAFVLIFAFLFRLESPTWKLVAIIGTMTGGVVMMVAGEVEFQLSGFILVISAAFFSGFRWALTQILLLRNPATSNPFSSIFFLAPVMFVTLMAIAVPVEGIFELVAGLDVLAQEWGYIKTPFLLLFPGTIAFLMTASEFALLQRTSVVTLSIAGIFKEVVTISAAALVFDDKLTPINISGLFITIGAIGAYNWIKFKSMRENTEQEVHDAHGRYERAQMRDSPDNSAGSGSESDEEEIGLLHGDDDIVENGLVTVDGDIIPQPRQASLTEDTKPAKLSRTEHEE